MDQLKAEREQNKKYISEDKEDIGGDLGSGVCRGCGGGRGSMNWCDSVALIGKS